MTIQDPVPVLGSCSDCVGACFLPTDTCSHFPWIHHNAQNRGYLAIRTREKNARTKKVTVLWNTTTASLKLSTNLAKQSNILKKYFDKR